MADFLMPATTRHSCQLCGHRGCGELVVMTPQQSGSGSQYAGVHQRQGLHPRTSLRKVLRACTCASVRQTFTACFSCPANPPPSDGSNVLGPVHPLGLCAGDKGVRERRGRDGRALGRKGKGVRKKGGKGSWKQGRAEEIW